ncbi:MAG: FAD-dependent oxidoreductase [Candidatus Margulisiibacteriota bacterium]|jgi:sarcosine oxidase subunit alpha
MQELDVAICGAGPTGMAAAIKLFRIGVTNIKIFERNSELGGILNQCIHLGFGVSYYNEELTGPEYAFRMSSEIKKLNIPYQLNSMIIDIDKNKVLTVTSYEKGLEKYKAKAIIFATGCRERTRENIEVAGTRPAGIFTAGLAQNLINLKKLTIGKNIIIQGSGDIGLIMARRLKIEGYNVLKVFERLPYLSGLIRNKAQCLDDFEIPIEFNTEIVDIDGIDRVKGVSIQKLDDNLNPVFNSKEYYECDTVLFAVGLIPEIDLLRNAGAEFKNRFNLWVNSKFETNIEGIFVAGNSLHIHDLADNASLEGETVATFVKEFLESNQSFRMTSSGNTPYKEIEVNKDFDNKYFKNLNNNLVCIICPKGCQLSFNNYGCKKGQGFFIKESQGKKRKFTTTIFNENDKKIDSVCSEDEVDINSFPLIKKELDKISEIKEVSFSININNQKISFRTKRRI